MPAVSTTASADRSEFTSRPPVPWRCAPGSVGPTGVQGPSRLRAGRSPGVREADPSGVPQAALWVSEPGLWDLDVDRAGADGRAGDDVDDDSAGRWATVQVGRFARPFLDVAAELRCSWHHQRMRQQSTRGLDPVEMRVPRDATARSSWCWSRSVIATSMGWDLRSSRCARGGRRPGSASR